MNANEVLKSVKVLLGMEEKPVVVNLKEFNLKDGTKISVDKLDVGGIVTIDGKPTVGEFELEDGTKIKTDKDGIIIEIEIWEPITPEDVEALNQSMKEMLKACEGRITKLEETIASFSSKLEAKEVEFKAEIDVLKDQPKADPIFKEKENKRELTSSEARVESILSLKRQRSGLKK